MKRFLSAAILKKCSSPRLALLAIIAIQTLIQVPTFSLPPIGQHAWRQIVGYSIARNYHEEKTDFMRTRVDIRLNEDDAGEIYHEFPISYWLVGKSYDIFGETYFQARFIPFLVCISLVFACFHLMLALSSNVTLSIWFAFLTTSAPLFFYYAPTLVPNLIGLTFFVWASSFWVYLHTRGFSWTNFILATVFCTMATLCKPTYLFFGLVFGAVSSFSWFQNSKANARSRTNILLTSLITGGVALIINFMVIHHARELYEQAPFHRAKHTPIGPANLPWQLTYDDLTRNLSVAFTKWFFEMIVNLPAIPLFLFGVWQCCRAWWKDTQLTPTRIFWAAWAVSFACYALFFLTRFRDHDYYLTSLLPFAAYFSAIGADTFFKREKSRALLIPFLLITLGVGYGRVAGRWHRNIEIPRELLERSSEIVALTNNKDLVIVAGACKPNDFLFYLHRKGVCLDRLYLSDYSQFNFEPFKWFIHARTKKEIPPGFLEFVTLRKVKSVGVFDIYRMQKK